MNTAQLEELAVSSAISGDWQNAIKANIQILTQDPNCINALNRLAKAYAGDGNIAKAKALSRKVLSLDPHNQIAQKALAKWTAQILPKPLKTLDPDAFIEEPGKTKLIELTGLGDKKVLASLEPGEKVFLSLLLHRIRVINEKGKYIGRLPDNIAAKLKHFFKKSSSKEATVKSSSPNSVSILLRLESL